MNINFNISPSLHLNSIRERSRTGPIIHLENWVCWKIWHDDRCTMNSLACGTERSGFSRVFFLLSSSSVNNENEHPIQHGKLRAGLRQPFGCLPSINHQIRCMISRKVTPPRSTRYALWESLCSRSGSFLSVSIFGFQFFIICSSLELRPKQPDDSLLPMTAVRAAAAAYC